MSEWTVEGGVGRDDDREIRVDGDNLVVVGVGCCGLDNVEAVTTIPLSIVRTVLGRVGREEHEAALIKAREEECEACAAIVDERAGLARVVKEARARVEPMALGKKVHAAEHLASELEDVARRIRARSVVPGSAEWYQRHARGRVEIDAARGSVRVTMPAGTTAADAQAHGAYLRDNSVAGVSVVVTVEGAS